jgi:hypothetical protein
LLVGYRRIEVMVDCGLDWRKSVRRLRPGAIVLTHAQPFVWTKTASEILAKANPITTSGAEH